MLDFSPGWPGRGGIGRGDWPRGEGEDPHDDRANPPFLCNASPASVMIEQEAHVVAEAVCSMQGLMQGLRSPPTRALDSQAWHRLLQFLAADDPEPSQAYERMRIRLVKFFGWRGVRAADELVDETLTRVAMKLSQARIDGDRPAAFVLGVARLVFFEWARRESRWEHLDE